MKRGALSGLLLGLLLLFNLGMAIAVVGMFVNEASESSGLLMLNLMRLIQIAWMPGTVILGVLTLATRENRIIMVKKKEGP